WAAVLDRPPTGRRPLRALRNVPRSATVARSSSQRSPQIGAADLGRGLDAGSALAAAADQSVVSRTTVPTGPAKHERRRPPQGLQIQPRPAVRSDKAGEVRHT